MKDATDITIVLDRSGSMSSFGGEVLTAIQGFIKKQQETPGECNLTLISFDSCFPYQVDINNQPIKDAVFSEYHPGGGTPLYDALGRAINETGQRLAALRESERPDKVVFVVFTDGMENTSKEFKGGQIKEMIQHQEDKYNWEFIYLGANQDGFAAGMSYGFKGMSSASYSNNKLGDAVDMAASKLGSYRSTNVKADLNFSEADRRSLS